MLSWQKCEVNDGIEHFPEDFILCAQHYEVPK